MRWTEDQLALHLARTGAPSPQPHVDVSAPPFKPGLIIDLPFPPSANRIWRSQKAGKHAVYLSPEYAKWKKAADQLAVSLGQVKHMKRINGTFEALIVLQRRRGDIDNRVKAVLDWAQSREIILNDSLCERLVVERGVAPHGCRLILRPFTAVVA